MLSLKYPENVVKDALEKARQRDKHELRNPPPKENSDVLPFVFTYNPRNPQIYQRVVSCLTILDESAKMKNILEHRRVVPSKRQPPNLKAILTKSKFSSRPDSGKVEWCNDPCCANCEYLIEGDSILMENGELFHIKTEMTCQTSNVIYVIFCRGCNKSYIGETGEQLNKRACGHRTQVFNPSYRALEVCHHIAECGGSNREGPPPFRIAPFFKMPANCSRIEREGKEKFFQDKFCPSLHPGPRIEQID